MGVAAPLPVVSALIVRIWSAGEAPDPHCRGEAACGAGVADVPALGVAGRIDEAKRRLGLDGVGVPVRLQGTIFALLPRFCGGAGCDTDADGNATAAIADNGSVAVAVLPLLLPACCSRPEFKGEGVTDMATLP